MACLFGGALLAVAAPAAIVINPVPAPIAPGIKVGLTLFGQAQATGAINVDGYRTRIQSLKSSNDGTGRLFVNDTRGTISIVGAAGGTPATWFDIGSAVPGFTNAINPGQTGLLSFAFHPNFAGDPNKPGYGVFYTIDTSLASGTATLVGNGPSVNHDNVLHEFTVDDPRAAVAEIVSQREVLRAAQPLSDHGPGTIAFNSTAAPGDADYGKLYIGFGDGGGVGDPYGNAQDLGSPFGKILRIDPAEGPAGQPYTVPSDNPHVGEAGALGEVWASGLRNPQQFSWDKATGQLLVADIGQAQLEEVNIVVAGANYGWPLREGTFARGTTPDDPNAYDLPVNDGSYADPVAQFDHEEITSGGFGASAISGAFAYHGTGLPELEGMVIVSELVSGRLFYYDPDGVAAGSQAVLQELMLSFGGVDTTLAALAGDRVDLRMGTDADGELYLLSKRYGDIYRLATLGEAPEPAAWAMMVLGFGLIGATARRRRLRLA